MRVSDLIDGASCSWKEDLVREIFEEIGVDEILSIPISTQGIPDKGVWHHTADDRRIMLLNHSIWEGGLRRRGNRARVAPIA